jgi:hypothetical protein
MSKEEKGAMVQTLQKGKCMIEKNWVFIKETCESLIL